MTLGEDSEQLRKLARDVMSGDLTRDEYARRRRAVIDRYAGEAPVAVSLPDVPVLKAETDNTQPNVSVVPRPAGAASVQPDPSDRLPAAAGSARDLWIGMAAVGLVLLIVGGVLAYLW
ncbi:MAG: hypothetical protein ACOY33_11165 [Pseudomonadota bacterium]